MKKLFTIGLFTLGLALAPTLAHAENHEGGDHKKGGFFEKLDTNGDGSVSKAEFTAKSDERFAKMDTDGDGNITKAELDANREKYKKMREERKAKDKAGDETLPVEKPVTK